MTDLTRLIKILEQGSGNKKSTSTSSCAVKPSSRRWPKTNPEFPAGGQVLDKTLAQDAEHEGLHVFTIKERLVDFHIALHSTDATLALLAHDEQPPNQFYSSGILPASQHLTDQVAGQTLLPLATLPRWSEKTRVFQQISSSSKNPSRIQRAISDLLAPNPKERLRKLEKIDKLAAEACLMSQVLLSLWLWSMPQQMNQILQLLNPQAMRMQKCTMVPTLPSQQLMPENTAMQDVDPQDDIEEVIHLA
ncbi:hypothetical protein PCASD_20639 [Puccinia coronata f. sp. avenae]|uniref:Uncharacterized protein n=1 Tax=Puccinia coronata f. sp. avenae TaxID=200324 RepID=A0A2N5UDI7_9BASI|nr:hypothetical protein PCASD_20639 [Puccinia coronata f. sp. avenae]